MTFPHFDEPLALLLERDLTSRYGPMVSNDTLRLILGYASKEAFRQALSRKIVPVPIFTLAHRRGKFALVKDIAIWLAAQRELAITSDVPQTPPKPVLPQSDQTGGIS